MQNEITEARIRKAGQVAVDELVDRIYNRLSTPTKDDLADYMTRIVDACVSAALAAAEEQEPVADGWKTMDTAPKDGTRFVAMHEWPSGGIDCQVYSYFGAPDFWRAEKGCTCIRPEYQERYLWCALPGAARPSPPSGEGVTREFFDGYREESLAASAADTEIISKLIKENGELALASGEAVEARRLALEEAAKVVESFDPSFSATNSMLDDVAAAIRALTQKDKADA